ncbi:NADAR family protein [Pseudomaricurvus sp. HS19]|uniref:NADAR family protein n=1 Tax=Pseudomaricurvus sp. HS19 TaxID=2692626 RepID=UPI00136E635F|nr:NADAR family protein [Pseudomaricurvus sp. HS19]MYM64191.1 DUF1768 domain-containing protein [Pseudomaricurvus sp. HS19]
MSIFAEEDTNSLYLSRTDKEELLGTYSDHGIELEGEHWPTVEHYFQASKFSNNLAYREKIRNAATPEQAHKLGESWLKRKRSDWKQVREVIMTRGVYIKCRTYPAIAEQLLQSGDQRLVENSQYDYFWGCGRDRRGDNRYGAVLMNVRSKLQQEAAENS